MVGLPFNAMAYSFAALTLFGWVFYLVSFSGSHDEIPLVLPTKIESNQNNPSKNASPRVIIAQLDDRYCKKHPWDATDPSNNKSFLFHFAELNEEYARSHNYEYRIYCLMSPERHPIYINPAWYKPRAFEEMVEEAAYLDRPSYLLLMDSDVIIANETPLPLWLKQHSVDVERGNYTLMLGGLSNYLKTSAYFIDSGKVCDLLINTGVLYGYVDPKDHARTQRGINMVRKWQRGLCEPRCAGLTRYFWREQRCLEFMMIDQDESLDGALYILPGPISLWNDFNGKFVRHLYGTRRKEQLSADTTRLLDKKRELNVTRALELVDRARVRLRLSLDRVDMKDCAEVFKGNFQEKYTGHPWTCRQPCCPSETH